MSHGMLRRDISRRFIIIIIIIIIKVMRNQTNNKCPLHLNSVTAIPCELYRDVLKRTTS